LTKIIPVGQITMSTGDDSDKDDVDNDVLPTPLVYRDDEVMHTWLRVDWEVEAIGDVKDLLARFDSCSIRISSIISHLSLIQPSSQTTRASSGSEGALQ
jgi:hypothetical protein